MVERQQQTFVPATEYRVLLSLNIIVRACFILQCEPGALATLADCAYRDGLETAGSPLSSSEQVKSRFFSTGDEIVGGAFLFNVPHPASGSITGSTMNRILA